MKKIGNIVKKALIAIGAFFITLPTKVFGIDTTNIEFRPETMYGVQDPISYKIWDISKIIVIPLALIIGLIIYFKKSKKPLKNKILISLMAIISVIVVVLIIDKIIGNV